MELQNLLDQFPTVHLASPSDNDDILNLIATIPMQTSQGGVSFARQPNFFALTSAQGEQGFTFLFRNGDGSLGGVGCVSLMPMQVNGERVYVGYTSDLRLSPRVDRQTRREFYQFYEKLIYHFPEIVEFKKCCHVFATIYDGNVAARRALVTKNKKHPSALKHCSFHAFVSINVVGRIPLWIGRGQADSVVRAQESDQEAIMKHLTESLPGQQIVWSEDEVRRRMQVLRAQFTDFLLIKDENQRIAATCLLASDQNLRQVQVSRLPLSLRWGRPLLAWAGQPAVKPEQPLRIGHLTFCKSRQPQHRHRHICDFLHRIFDEQKNHAPKQRWHSITFQEPQGSTLLHHLRRQGFLATPLASTLYQVMHEEQPLQQALPRPQLAPDFDMIFH